MFLLNLLQSPLDFVAVLVGFFVVGVTVHEFAHAYVAYRLGDPTAKMAGRLSLNPLVHFDPIGIIMFFVIGFGWGKPVPINPYFLKHRRDELKVAVAGIIANLFLAAILAIPIRVALLRGVVIDSSPVLQFLNRLVDINIILATFNILPIPPLDGSHFVEYFLDPAQRMKFQYYGQYILIGLIVLGFASGVSVISVVMEPIMRIFSFIVRGTYLF